MESQSFADIYKKQKENKKIFTNIKNLSFILFISTTKLLFLFIEIFNQIIYKFLYLKGAAISPILFYKCFF